MDQPLAPREATGWHTPSGFVPMQMSPQWGPVSSDLVAQQHYVKAWVGGGQMGCERQFDLVIPEGALLARASSLGLCPSPRLSWAGSLSS